MSTKKIFRLLIASFGALALSGCKADEAAMSANPYSVSVDPVTNQAILTVNSTQDWSATIYGAQPWFTISPSSGKGMRRTAVTIEAIGESNDTLRIDSIKLVSGIFEKVVEVKQLGQVIYFPSTQGAFTVRNSTSEQTFAVQLKTPVVDSTAVRKVTLEVTSADATKGVEYDYETVEGTTTADVTIAAAAQTGILTIKGFYEKMTDGQTCTINISITGGDIKKANIKQNFTLLISRPEPALTPAP